jgi:hypothetical protein
MDKGKSAMNAMSFGSRTSPRPGTSAEQPRPDTPLDAAWMVLEAANDLGDDATVEACRRVIDASLNHAPPSQSDLHVVLDYFR